MNRDWLTNGIEGDEASEYGYDRYECEYCGREYTYGEWLDVNSRCEECGIILRRVVSHFILGVTNI